MDITARLAAALDAIISITGEIPERWHCLFCAREVTGWVGHDEDCAWHKGRAALAEYRALQEPCDCEHYNMACDCGCDHQHPHTKAHCGTKGEAE